MPVSPDSTRQSFAPVDVAWLDGAEARDRDHLGDTIVLGRRGGSEKLIMRFSVTLPPDEKLQKAILRLDPLPRCEHTPGRIALELADVLEPWTSAQLARGRQPKLDIPMRLADTSATPARPLMLDVTEIVKRWSEHPDRYQGVALLAIGDSPSGACFTSGLSWGRGPRLTLYFWPPDRDAGADAADGSDGDAMPDGGSHDASGEAS